jgi:hypothetical protein
MINQLVKDWAWQVNDGMPDPKDRTHLEVLEEVLRAHKYSEEFIYEYISQLKNPILEKKGDTSATTFYHEIISGIAAVKSVSVSDFKTGEDLKKFFDNGTIAPVNSGLSTFNIMSMKQARFLTKDSIPNPKIVGDAISSGKAIKSQLKGFSKAYWAGPTNDASDFGAADIILSKGGAAKGVGVSMKYGKGQLKNLSANSFYSAIIGSSSSSFMHQIHDLNSDGFNKMTAYFVELLDTKIKSLTKDKDALKAWKSIVPSIKTWDGYQKKKIDTNSAQAIANAISFVDFKKLKNMQYLGRKVAEGGLADWNSAKEQYFDIFFGTFTKSYDSIIKKNLVGLLKRQLSVTKKDLWYSASGGSNLKMIPGSERFDEIAKTLEISHTHKVSGTGYQFFIHVKQKGIELGTVTVTIRWKKGQMQGYPDTTSSAKWKINNQQWGEIFK